MLTNVPKHLNIDMFWFSLWKPAFLLLLRTCTSCHFLELSKVITIYTIRNQTLLRKARWEKSVFHLLPFLSGSSNEVLSSVILWKSQYVIIWRALHNIIFTELTRNIKSFSMYWMYYVTYQNITCATRRQCFSQREIHCWLRSLCWYFRPLWEAEIYFLSWSQVTDSQMT